MVVDTKVCETQTTVSSKPNSEAHEPKAAAKIDPCHLEVGETQTTTIAPPPDQPKAAFAEAVAKIDPCHLAYSLSQIAEAFSEADQPEFLLADFLGCLGSLLSGVSFRWDDIFKEPVRSKLFHDVIDLSHIPESVYNITVEWITKHLPVYTLSHFVRWTFRFIIESVWKKCCHKGERSCHKSNVSILVAAAILLRRKPHIVPWILGDLYTSQLRYEKMGALTTPLVVWMIAQASQGDLLVGLRLWAVLLVPLFDRSSDQSKDLILELVENISKQKPDARTKLEIGYDLVPFPSFEILLRLTFPAREEATTRRFAGVYPFLKDVVLAGVPEYIFAFCLRLDKQGNPDLAKEVTEIAFWCLTQDVDCWEKWEYLCKENLETSVALLKRLVEKLEDHSLEQSFLSPSDFRALTKHWLRRNQIKKVSFTQTASDEEAIQQVKIQQEAMEQEVKMQQVKIFTQKLLTFSLRFAGEGNPVLAKEATETAIWSLTESVVWWKLWEYLYKENLEVSVAILKKLVEKCKDGSLKLNHTLARAPDSKAMKQVTQKIFTQKIFTFSLRLAERGNHDLAKEATEMATEMEAERGIEMATGNPDLAKEAIEMAIWSLTENIDCWKCWDYLYKKNLEASVALLKKLVEKWKDRSLKPSSSSSDTLEKIYTLSLRLAGEGNHVLAKEATEIALWSLAKKDDLYKKNLKAVVALLKKPIDEWKDHSLKRLSSASDILTLSRTMKSFRLKNKKAITQGGANGSLYKEADKPCKVIWGRLSCGSCSLKGTWIATLVLIIAVAARTVYMCERVFCFDN